MSWIERRLRIFAATGAIALALCASANAQITGNAFDLPACERVWMGLVHSIEPASGHASTMWREGQEVRLHLMAPLCAGDVISVGSGARVIVSTASDPSWGPPFDELMELHLGPGTYTVGLQPPIIVPGDSRQMYDPQ